MLVVHHLNNSRSQRVLWLLEELGLDYEVRHYQRDPKTMRAPLELREVHPLGKSPVVTDGATVLAETGAIIDYLVNRDGERRLTPEPGSADHLRFVYFMHYAEGSAMPPLLMKLVFDKIAAAPVPFFVKPVVKGIVAKVSADFITPQLKNHLDFLEAELADRPWFAGQEFSAADVQMSFPLEAAAQRAGLDESRPRLMDFLRRIHARPAYRRALERGGPYAFAK
ncbi:glutathione S-transferase [Piscinibacter sakaiensis]|uniref:glutathione S-transferase n=1 Tax=Piscinibacter sakaiensis TaxID=1547922 RepID=UPI003AACF3CF